jgi:hypothetical protein
MQDLQQDRSIAGEDAQLDALKAGVSGQCLMATVSELARFAKLAGTPTELQSLETLRSRFLDAGFAVSLILHDAYISLPGRASLHIGADQYACITHSMARSTPKAGLQAELVDLGAAREADMSAQHVADKIAIVDGIATPEIAHRISRFGASGVIQVSPHEHLHEMCVSPVWGNPSLETMHNLPTCSAVTVSEADGILIRERLASAKGKSAVIHAEVDTGWRKTPILIAEMTAPGAGADDPYVLFSGHHDTWYYGVMDNGSANATIVEVARLVAAQRTSWKRGLRICIWSGHSQGRYSGSAWYVDHNWSDLEKRCVAHVNIDSPGGIGASNLRNTGVMSALRPLAARAIAAETGQKLAGKPKVRSADESLQSLGIPSMFGSLSGQVLAADSKMRNALGWWWHTPEDLIDKIDERNLVRDTKVVLECLWRLLSGEVLPVDLREPLIGLGRELEVLKAKLSDAIDLAPLSDRLGRLSGATDALLAKAAPGEINSAILAISRDLVMLEHSRGDRFIHEPALNQNAWPVLDSLRRLAAQPPGSDLFKFAHVDAVRSCNRLAWHLDKMAERLEECAT